MVELGIVFLYPQAFRLVLMQLIPESASAFGTVTTQNKTIEAKRTPYTKQKIPLISFFSPIISSGSVVEPPLLNCLNAPGSSPGLKHDVTP